MEIPFPNPEHNVRVAIDRRTGAYLGTDARGDREREIDLVARVAQTVNRGVSPSEKEVFMRLENGLLRVLKELRSLRDEVAVLHHENENLRTELDNFLATGS